MFSNFTKNTIIKKKSACGTPEKDLRKPGRVIFERWTSEEIPYRTHSK